MAIEIRSKEEIDELERRMNERFRHFDRIDNLFEWLLTWIERGDTEKSRLWGFMLAHTGNKLLDSR